MKAIMVMYDSLNRHMLSPYGCGWTYTENFSRLAKHAVTFDNCWVGSMPCMPARRELHTGRYNFLHRSWGPLEPFDDSMPQQLKDAGIHTHLVSDHYHYWEDGGATYHQRYTTWECVRGQEGDNWQPLVGFSGGPEPARNVCGDPKDNWVGQDFANRTVMKDKEKQSQCRTFQKGLEFLCANHKKDNWFLQIETFDPHEPFFCQPEYQKLFSDSYEGPFCDWPDYRPVNEEDSPEFIAHMRNQYGALLKLCDENLGKILDAMDQYGLWEDTMLIVNTDHGFLLAEHGQWAKCHCPFYGEVAHTPLFIWDPRSRRQNVRTSQLVQTIDLPATLLEYFGQPLFPNMEGRPLRPVLEKDQPVREGALFGIFGGQVCCTDGNWVYMRSPISGNSPRYEYTLMPTCHGGRRAFIQDEILKEMKLSPPFSFTKGIPVLKLPSRNPVSQADYSTMLFCLTRDPDENCPLTNPKEEQRMKELMKKMMTENDSPKEQFVRMGL
ncbi:MAG: sulfatase [Lachnospiraceae bacterium]